MDARPFALPDRYPLTFEPTTGTTTFVRLDEAAYAAASFLDERRLERAAPGETVPWDVVRAAAADLFAECDFIFHLGHVGSTLVSRLLGRAERVFSVREPAVLQTLAGLGGDPEFDERARVFLKLWARTFAPGRKALLKATSFTAEIGPALMRLNPSARAILMFVSPSVYLAGVLGGEGSRQEVEALAPSRLERLHARLGRAAWRLEALDEGEAAAMGWLAEIAALAAIARDFPDRILWLEFERFLARPAAGLAACLRRLHGEASPAEVEAILHGPDMTRYAKAPEFSYDANLRRRVLAQASEQHADQIAKGIAWLNAAGGAHPMLADAMRRAGAAARAAAA